jgi:phosphoglycerate kinase
VLVRVDLNVPMQDGAVSDDTRLRASAPTIPKLAAKGARCCCCRTSAAQGGQPPRHVGQHDVDAVQAVLGRPVRSFIEDCGARGRAAVGIMQPGDIAMLENTRFLEGRGKERSRPRQGNGRARRFLRQRCLFGRAPRPCRPKGWPTCCRLAGRAMEAELKALEAALGDPERPVAAVVGGAKVSTKLAVLGTSSKRSIT